MECGWLTEWFAKNGAYLILQFRTKKKAKICIIANQQKKMNKRNAIAPISLFFFLGNAPFQLTEQVRFLSFFPFFLFTPVFGFYFTIDIRFNRQYVQACSTRWWLARFRILLIPLEFDCVRATFSPGLISTVSTSMFIVSVHPKISHHF